MMKILWRRKPAHQEPDSDTQGTLEDMAMRRPRTEEEDVVGISGGRTPLATIDPEAGREMVEPRTTEGRGV